MKPRRQSRQTYEAGWSQLPRQSYPMLTVGQTSYLQYEIIRIKAGEHQGELGEIVGVTKTPPLFLVKLSASNDVRQPFAPEDIEPY